MAINYEKKKTDEDARLKKEQQEKLTGAETTRNDRLDYLSGAKTAADELAKSQYDTSVELLAAQRDAAAEQLMNQVNRQKTDNENAYQDSARQANIQRMQAQRDLPQRLAAQGVSGGLSESGNIALRTQYGNDLAGFKNTRDTANANADLAYNDAILGVNSAYDQGELTAKSAYDTAVAKALADYNAGVQAAKETYNASISDINSTYGQKIQDNLSYYEQLIEAAAAEEAARKAAEEEAARKAAEQAARKSTGGSGGSRSSGGSGGSGGSKSSGSGSGAGNTGGRLQKFIDGLSNMSETHSKLNYLRQMQLRGQIDDADFSWLANKIVGVSDDYVAQFFYNQASQGRPYMTGGEWNNYINGY